MKTDSEILKELALEQKALKKKRYILNIKIQGLYDRWKRNAISVDERGGARYIPLQAVVGLGPLLSKLGKVERRLRDRRDLITIMSEMMHPKYHVCPVVRSLK